MSDGLLSVLMNSAAGDMGDNIPNVAFTSGADGEADKVAAIDVEGNLWLMDIWKFHNCPPHQRIEQIHRPPYPPTRQRRLWEPGRNQR